ncbi:hypothetical protein [Halosegnis sp.]|uniref:DUF7139 domain-containing protein n=1 Tax=Halosegnis sp. TaxID=2864959 RepID=UPI0035D460D4
MFAEREQNALVAIYSDRFGEPFTTDEVYGYWLFVAGTVVAVLGMALFLVSMGAGRSGTREVAYLLAGSGLVAALAGLVVGQSFHGRYEADAPTLAVGEEADTR